MADDPSHSLEALERSWRLEKAPQVGLRLAELYRRRGDLDSSIEALHSGLEVYPNHTASRVALSRYLIDGERFAEAIPHLEKITALDPAHLVANKLLVGAYAGVGRIEEGRDKLAIYEMMGEGDADIESLRRLLEAAETRASTALLEAPAAIIVKDSATNAEPEQRVEEETVSRPDPDRVEPIQISEPEAPAGLSADTPTAFLEPALSEGSASAVGPAASEPSEAPEPPEASSEPFGVLPTGDALAGSAESEEPFGAAFGPTLPSRVRANKPGDDVFSLAAPQSQEPAATSPDVAVDFEDLDAVDTDSPDDEAPLSGALARERKATVTLGRLYLEQGLRDQALEVFEEVLVHDPENQEARRELEATRDAAPQPATPDAQLGKPRPAEEVAFARAVVAETAIDLVERKKAALISYRERLRNAVAAGV